MDLLNVILLEATANAGGAIGADQFVVERLLRLGQSEKATIFSAWKQYSGFPVKVRDMPVVLAATVCIRNRSPQPR